MLILQDDHGELSSVNMDTAVAIRTLEATFKSSADAAAVETMILKLTEKVEHYQHQHSCFIQTHIRLELLCLFCCSNSVLYINEKKITIYLHITL